MVTAPLPGWLRWLAALFALAFLASAALQYNDPDPAPWMALYGAAAIGCLVAGRWRWAPLWIGLVAAAALGWALAIAAGIDRLVAPGDLVASMEMTGGPVEETREVLGLGIVAGWMIVLLIAERRARARRGGG